MISRRHLLQGSLLGLLAACTRSEDYTSEDVLRLDNQREEEARRSGQGPFGPLRFAGYQGLTRLPYFRTGTGGFLETIPPLPETIDFHAHLGWSNFLAPRVDLTRRTPRTEYLLDCDAQNPPCTLDLDVYVNANFTESMHRELSWQTLASLLFGSGAAATHTVPNLLAEMDAAGVHRAAILPIATNLPLSEDPTLLALDAIRSSGAVDRFIAFGSVHPHDPTARQRLRQYKQAGVRGIKLHPEMQRFFPDDPRAMEVYEECGRLQLPVIFHAGRSGIEPEFLRPYALLRRYEPGMRDFPGVTFVLGHAGARDVGDAVPLARKYDNVWLELSSQGATQVRDLLNALGAHKLLYGTDWPFYPLVVSLAKVLLVTEGQPEARRLILGGNARSLLFRT